MRFLVFCISPDNLRSLGNSYRAGALVMSLIADATFINSLTNLSYDAAIALCAAQLVPLQTPATFPAQIYYYSGSAIDQIANRPLIDKLVDIHYRTRRLLAAKQRLATSLHQGCKELFAITVASCVSMRFLANLVRRSVRDIHLVQRYRLFPASGPKSVQLDYHTRNSFSRRGISLFCSAHRKRFPRTKLFHTQFRSPIGFSGQTGNWSCGYRPPGCYRTICSPCSTLCSPYRSGSRSRSGRHRPIQCPSPASRCQALSNNCYCCPPSRQGD
jgi:hypothetical protein